MLATPISGPAWVKKVKSESLVRLDSGELVIHRDFNVVFISLAAFRASTVSAVSPLWDRVTKRVLSKRIGRRYRYSLAISTLQGTLAISSNHYIATTPAL